jgi:hypothetical protein
VPERGDFKMKSLSRSIFLMDDLVGKPVITFPDHTLGCVGFGVV